MTRIDRDRTWMEDKAKYRDHIDAIVAAYERFGTRLTPDQERSMVRYRRITKELKRECGS